MKIAFGRGSASRSPNGLVPLAYFVGSLDCGSVPSYCATDLDGANVSLSFRGEAAASLPPARLNEAHLTAGAIVGWASLLFCRRARFFRRVPYTLAKG
jgi:hypothetical protein